MEAVAEWFGHAQISNLYFEFSVDDRDPGDGNNKLTRSRELVRAIETGCAETAADEALVDLANRVLASEYAREHYTALLASLAADGFEWGLDSLGHCSKLAGYLLASPAHSRRDGVPAAMRPDLLVPNTRQAGIAVYRVTSAELTILYRSLPLVPAMPVPAQPAPEVSALESDLNSRGLTVAATHYRQTIDNFVDRNFEAANGQLRSFLEALFRAIGISAGAQDNVGAAAAVVHLRRVGLLDDAESQFLRGLWAGAQDNGPHAGLTNEEEARFRLHTATAAARYLLRKGQ